MLSVTLLPDVGSLEEEAAQCVLQRQQKPDLRKSGGSRLGHEAWGRLGLGGYPVEGREKLGLEAVGEGGDNW